MEDIESQARLKQLRANILCEPVSKKIRPQLVEYIKVIAGEASKLTAEQRNGRLGHGLAMDIAGPLAFQGANGVEGDDWITEDDEPVLYRALDVAGRLDANPNDPDAWNELFEIVRGLN